MRILNNKITISLLLLFSISFSGWTDGSVEQWINDLKGDDAQARVHARQMLPLMGVDVIPSLFPLMQHPDFAVHKSVNDVLFCLINEACVPGREKDRRLATDYLMELLEPDKDDSLKTAGMKLLALAIPPKYDLKPLAKCLDNPKLQETARYALQRIGSPKACEDLRRALRQRQKKDGDPAFTCALMNSLGDLRDEKSLKIIAKFAECDNPAILSAAALALSWSGDPEFTPLMWKAIEKAADTPEAKASALDALVRHADAMSEKEELHANAIEIYEKILHRDYSAHTCAALAGLGKIGGADNVQPLLNALISDNYRVQASAASALANLQGSEAEQKILSLFESAPDEMKVLLSPILGARHDAAAFPLLAKTAQSEEWPLRLTALEALGELGHPDGLPLISQAIAKPGADNEIGMKAIARLAERLHEEKDAAQAGKAYALLLQHSAETGARQRALEGIAANPTPEAFDIIMQAAADEALKEQSLPALAAVAIALANAGQKDKTLQAFEKIAAMKPSAQTMQQLANRLRAQGLSVATAGMMGFVLHWKAIGPFPIKDGQGWDVDIIGEANADASRPVKFENRSLEWKPIQANDETGVVNLIPSLGSCEQCIAYAYAEITVLKNEDAVLKLGVDDSEKIWLNGELVFSQFAARPLQVDQDSVPVKLKAGNNSILMKIYQNNLGWEFCLRLMALDGSILAFAQSAE
ncbi:MAG: HEAT repeat domain-containing protein [Candidatus Omnitrophota bacterium]